jgi:hypothetical protein
MSNIVPFSSAALPAYLQNRKALSAINADVASVTGFPSLSIKGKVFTLTKGKEKKILTREIDGEQEPLQSMSLSVVRANKNARVFYAKAYSEEDSEGAKSTCYSNNGVTPAADAASPQAKKCQLCPQAVWGAKVSADGAAVKGTPCTVNTRLAVIDPNQADEPWLLKVPAGSRKNFADACAMADTRGLPYNAVVLKIAFDPAAPAPKLTFKPVGLVSDEVYEKITEMYESDSVKEMIGLIERAAPALPAPVEADELDAALEAKKVVETAKAKPAAKPAAKPVVEEVGLDDLDAALDEAPAPKAKPAAKPAAKAKPAPVIEDADEVEEAVEAPKAKAKPATTGTGMDDLLGDLDDLLSSTDD